MKDDGPVLNGDGENGVGKEHMAHGDLRQIGRGGGVGGGDMGWVGCERQVEGSSA